MASSIEKLAKTKIRYVLWIFPVVLIFNSLLVNDGAILQRVQSGQYDIISLDDKILPLNSLDQYILATTIIWYGIVPITAAFVIAVLIARRKVKKEELEFQA